MFKKPISIYYIKLILFRSDKKFLFVSKKEKNKTILEFPRYKVEKIYNKPKEAFKEILNSLKYFEKLNVGYLNIPYIETAMVTGIINGKEIDQIYLLFVSQKEPSPSNIGDFKWIPFDDIESNDNIPWWEKETIKTNKKEILKRLSTI